MKGAKILAILVVGVMSVSLLATVERPDKVPKQFFEAIWDALVDLQGQVDAEETARIDDVDAEEARSIAAELALQNALTQEIADRIAGDDSLQAAISSGDTATASAAQAANDALQSALEAAIASGDTATASAAQAANDALQSALEAAIAVEESTRAAADTQLQSNIGAEEAARIAADGALGERIDNIQLLPTGVIVMWSGSTIPDGWALCDGEDGTPDLRGRFIVGSGGSYAVDDTGGENAHVLSVSEMPSHRHFYSGNTNQTGYHDHGLEDKSFLNDQYDGHWGDHDGDHHFATPKDIKIKPAGNHWHHYSGNTNYQGGSHAHENRPPYYALAYIMKVE